MDIYIQVAALLVLLALSFFFSSAETALTCVSDIRMRTLSDEGNERAKMVLKVKEDPQRMLSAILIGNNIVNLSASSITTALAISLVGRIGAGIATGILTFFILVFGEIAPKNMATIKSADLALRYAGVIYRLMVILTPVIRFINFIGIGVLSLAGISKDDREEGITEEELKTIVDVSHETGVIEEDEKDYIQNVFDFSDQSVREVMIPRIDMTVVNVNWSFDKLIQVFKENMFTRLPVYEDEEDNIVGIINMKDVFVADKDAPFTISRVMRKPFFTFELKKTSDLFDDMRQNSISMAIVLDEFGSLAGMVTLEDLLEELVGEIRDEFDSYEEDDIVEIEEGEYEVLGSTNLDDLMDEIPLGFESEDYDTIGGYLTGLFDHFPKVGETYVTEDGAILSVIKVTRRRVEKIRIRLQPKEGEEV